MVKNKIKTRVLTFVSTFIILLSLLSIVAFAQAPQLPLIEYNAPINDICVITSDGLNTLAYIQIIYSDDFTTIADICIVYSEYFYNNVYTGNSSFDSLYIIVNQLDFNMRLISNRIKQYVADDVYLIDALSQFSQGTFPVGSSTWYQNSFLNDYEKQFTYWENEIDEAELNGYNNGHSVGFDNGYAEGQQTGLQTGYNNGFNEGYNEALSVGYTNALNDYKAFEKGLFAIFNAPFTFVSNITTFEIFGISLIDVVVFILIICLSFILLKFIGGSIL